MQRDKDSQKAGPAGTGPAFPLPVLFERGDLAMNRNTDYASLLDRINPALCSYEEWVKVGMALKHECCSPELWDSWSAGDPARYHPGECQRKWDSFREDSNRIITGATIVHLADAHDLNSKSGGAISWDSTIEWEGNSTMPLPDNSCIPGFPDWHPAQQVISYLEALFLPDENVGYVMQSRIDTKRGKYFPGNKGAYDRTAGELIAALKKCGDDIGAVLGDYDPAGGAWIRMNPVDGKGIRNENVTAFRHALVESDDMPVEDQYRLLHELHLPISALVHSGGKSLHAIVRIDAPDETEYRKRVAFLYKVCEEHGLHIDKQNKNPSRMSRLPGVIRGDAKQSLIETGTGAANWEEWKSEIESAREKKEDSLPELENLSYVWDSMPDLAPELISGILRDGHKMLLAGPSKAGKSFLLIELVICIAEGRTWLGHPCRQGNVLYVNLELDRASCLHRFRKVYTALGIRPENLHRISIWNLRGQAVPLDSLVPKLIKRTKALNPAAIIIDPVYKVITGDENSAEQMAKFCSQLDKICTELGCAVIYCHHHSKGSQGGKKSMDRASGSGVFARDADALLDLIELPVSEELRDKVIEEEIRREVLDNWIRKTNAEDSWSSDSDRSTVAALISHCESALAPSETEAFRKALDNACILGQMKSAWQISATLREFPESPPLNIWYSCPVHSVDDGGLLKDIRPEQNDYARSRLQEHNRKNHEKSVNDFISHYSFLSKDGEAVAVSDIADSLNLNPATVSSWFGTGSKRKEDLAQRFEKKTGPDGRIYICQKTFLSGHRQDP